MRGTLDPHTDPLRDLLECPMGENPGGRKPETQIIQSCFVNKTYHTSYRIHRMHWLLCLINIVWPFFTEDLRVSMNYSRMEQPPHLVPAGRRLEWAPCCHQRSWPWCLGSTRWPPCPLDGGHPDSCLWPTEWHTYHTGSRSQLAGSLCSVGNPVRKTKKEWKLIQWKSKYNIWI